jgi:hypothetical protein
MAELNPEMTDDVFGPLLPVMGDKPIAPAHGIAALALSLSMKYHDMAMIKDGAMYQAYKMEGRNIQTVGLKEVLDTAEKLEVWLLGASDRIAKIIVDAIEFRIDDDKDRGVEQPGSSPAS